MKCFVFHLYRDPGPSGFSHQNKTEPFYHHGIMADKSIFQPMMRAMWLAIFVCGSFIPDLDRGTQKVLGKWPGRWTCMLLSATSMAASQMRPTDILLPGQDGEDGEGEGIHGGPLPYSIVMSHNPIVARR